VDILKVDIGLMVWTLLTFAGLLLLLARFAFRPLKRILGEREATLRTAMEKAEEASRHAQEVSQRNEQQLDEARTEARRIIAEGQKIVAQMRRETQESARQESEQIIRQARTEIEQEVRRGLDDLKGSVANLSLRIARQVIKEELDEKRHDRLVTEFIERLKESHERGK